MVFAATSKEDCYRKPRVGMWNEYGKEMGSSLEDGESLRTASYLANVFFVGDAAGRIRGPGAGRTADHGDSDRYALPFSP